MFPELSQEVLVAGLYLSQIVALLPAVELDGVPPRLFLKELLQLIHEDERRGTQGDDSKVKLDVLEALRASFPDAVDGTVSEVSYNSNSDPDNENPGVVVLALPLGGM